MSKMEIRKEELLELIRSLVVIPSHYLAPGGEARVGEELEKIAAREGLSSSRMEIEPGRFNCFITLEGTAPGPHILLCGHMDTVLTEGMEIEPYSSEERDGRIWGRGTVDMKGGLGAMLYAMILLKRQGIPLKGKITLIGTVGEECPHKSEGAYALRSLGHFADMAVIGEATELKIAVAHKGTISLEASIRGKAAHSSNPALGDNAIYKAAALIQGIEKILVPRLEQRIHPLVGKATINVGMIRGGVQNNIVPESCILGINRRYLPGETEAQVIEEIMEIWRQLPYPEEDIRIEALEETDHRVAMETDPEEEVVQSLVRSAQATGLPGEVVGVNYWTDGAHLRAVGIPTVVFGPGNIAQAHAAVEYIEVDQLLKAVEAYMAFLWEQCAR